MGTAALQSHLRTGGQLSQCWRSDFKAAANIIWLIFTNSDE